MQTVRIYEEDGTTLVDLWRIQVGKGSRDVVYALYVALIRDYTPCTHCEEWFLNGTGTEGVYDDYPPPMFCRKCKEHAKVPQP